MYVSWRSSYKLFSSSPIIVIFLYFKHEFMLKETEQQTHSIFAVLQQGSSAYDHASAGW